MTDAITPSILLKNLNGWDQISYTEYVDDLRKVVNHPKSGIVFCDLSLESKDLGKRSCVIERCEGYSVDKKYKVSYDSRLKSIEIEIDEFDDRYEQGDSILKAEWDNMSSDWHGEMCSTLDYLISEVNYLSVTQRKRLDDILFRVSLTGVDFTSHGRT